MGSVTNVTLIANSPRRVYARSALAVGLDREEGTRLSSSLRILVSGPDQLGNQPARVFEHL